MVIRNNLNAAIPIPDVTIQGGFGIVIAPMSTITIFNAAASGSKILPLFFESGILTNLGDSEPVQGNGMQVSGAPGPLSWVCNISSGTVSGGNLVLTVPGLLSTDTIVSILVNMGSNSGRASTQAVQCLAGFTNQQNGSLTLVFVDSPPPTGSVTITVTR